MVSFLPAAARPRPGPGHRPGASGSRCRAVTTHPPLGSALGPLPATRPAGGSPPCPSARRRLGCIRPQGPGAAEPGVAPRHPAWCLRGTQYPAGESLCVTHRTSELSASCSAGRDVCDVDTVSLSLMLRRLPAPSLNAGAAHGIGSVRHVQKGQRWNVVKPSTAPSSSLNLDKPHSSVEGMCCKNIITV